MSAELSLPARTRLRVLGPLEIVADGRRVPVRRGRPRTLLLALVVRQGRPVSTDALIEDVWGDSLPKSPRNALQILVSYLRKALAASDPCGPRIETSPVGYRLVASPGAVDAVVFERSVDSLADVVVPGDRLRRADEALSLWRGEPFADAAYETFAQPAIARLHELRIRAAAARAQALLDLELDDVALSDLRGLVAEHPLDERFRGQLIVALYRTGRQAEALRAYESARHDLIEGLGIEPTPQLQTIARAVLDHAPSLQPGRASAGSSRSDSTGRHRPWPWPEVAVPTPD